MVLLLDLDDTLFCSRSAYGAGLRAIGLEAGTPSYLSARKRAKARLPKFSPALHNRAIYLKELMQKEGKFSPSRLLELLDIYEREVSSHIVRQWKALDRKKLLRALRTRYSKIGLITNETLLTQAKKLNAIDPELESFDFVVTSEEAGYEKPHPQIFKLALSYAKVEAGRCVMVGDSLENDVFGARKLGIRAVQTKEFLRHNDPIDKRGPIIGKLSELKDLEFDDE